LVDKREWVMVIMAGGQSRRMGQTKALLPLSTHTTETFIDHLVNEALHVSERILIISNEQDMTELKTKFRSNNRIQIYLDNQPFRGEGPLAGLLTAMEQAPAPYYAVTACDTPALNHRYWHHIYQRIRGAHDCWIPRADDHIHPLAGVYRHMPDKIRSFLHSGQRRIYDFLLTAHPYYFFEAEWQSWLGSEANPFININLPEQYKEWLKQTDQKKSIQKFENT